MLVGINYPWIDYGWDFADPPHAWVPEEQLSHWREQKRNRIKEDFKLFASQGFFAVRWFLLADGLNYGMDESAPRFNGKSWIFDPLPEKHPFYSQLMNDFGFVLQVCRENKLMLLPSLVDFSWCHSGMPTALHPGIVKGGRYEIVRNPEKRRAFFDRILDPLIDRSMAFRETIYAWEIINEPEWVVRGFWKRGANRNVSSDEMMEFIAEGIRRIEVKRLEDGSSAFKTSVGFAHWKTWDKWNAEMLGITLHQFHYYAQENRKLPENPHSAERPRIVGEFATARGRDWPDLIDKNQEQTISNRLTCMETKGYPACLMWSANGADPATRWTEDEQKEMVAYNRLKPRFKDHSMQEGISSNGV